MSLADHLLDPDLLERCIKCGCPVTIFSSELCEECYLDMQDTYADERIQDRLEGRASCRERRS